MTCLQKHKQNQKLIQNYMDYLPECTDYNSRLKLITEIGRLNQQNKQIDKMSFEDIQKDCNDFPVEILAVF